MISPAMQREMIKFFYRLGSGNIDSIASRLAEQLLREGSSDFLSMFRSKDETDLMALAKFIKTEVES